MLKASVVISTYNRGSMLRDAILSISRQTYPEVEIVVVNGPSTDNTATVLDALEADGVEFKRATCPRTNLSQSRNIGIGAASGDVAFFLDDDAVAHRQWVSRLIPPYYDNQVGAAGGFTFDHTGVSFQCRYTVCDRYGNARYFDTLDPASLIGRPGVGPFPSLLGTNCSFARSELDQIGGFDETFEYMLDETDVCARIVDRGKRIVTVPDAYVFHRYAPNHMRAVTRVPRSLIAAARSKAYFCFKHAEPKAGKALAIEVVNEIERYRKEIEFSNRWYLDHKAVSPAHYAKLNRDLAEGLDDGVKRGLAVRGVIPAGAAAGGNPKVRSAFSPVRSSRSGTVGSDGALRVYFVSQGFPPRDTAGIARWTYESARELWRRGHEVHVVTRSPTKTSYVDYVGGLWVHAVPDAFDDDITLPAPISLPPSIMRRASAVLTEIQRSARIWGVDMVSAPIWDVEGVMCAAYLNVPVVTSLHTTYKLVRRFKPEWTRSVVYRSKHVDKVIRAEHWLLKHCTAVLANSNQIVAEIDREYSGVLASRSGAVAVVPHGSNLPLAATESSRGGGALKPERVKVLLVGRMEIRKGVDLLLEAMRLLGNRIELMEFDLVGDSPSPGDPYVTRVMDMANALRRRWTRTRLTIHGYVPDEDLDGYYRTADILVMPSRYESFGLVLIEAMRHGIPVIACDAGGMREVITEGVDGFLVGVENAAALAERIGRLAADADLRKRMGRAARDSYEARFTAAHMGEQMENIFKRLAMAANNE
jgi:glycosyltransferase involved in cell wall biosynthesis